jgi:hypothetical protein
MNKPLLNFFLVCLFESESCHIAQAGLLFLLLSVRITGRNHHTQQQILTYYPSYNLTGNPFSFTDLNLYGWQLFSDTSPNFFHLSLKLPFMTAKLYLWQTFSLKWIIIIARNLFLIFCCSAGEHTRALCPSLSLIWVLFWWRASQYLLHCFWLKGPSLIYNNRPGLSVTRMSLMTKAFPSQSLIIWVIMTRAFFLTHQNYDLQLELFITWFISNVW